MDFLVIVGELYSNDELVSMKTAPGFVRIKWNKETLFHVFHESIESVQFINGLKLKKFFAEKLKSSSSLYEVVGVTSNVVEPSSESASIEYTTKCDLAKVPLSIEQSLNMIPSRRQNNVVVACT
jgi:hypothetical protein